MYEILTDKQSGVSGLLDVARQTFKEATQDVHQHVTDVNGTKDHIHRAARIDH